MKFIWCIFHTLFLAVAINCYNQDSKEFIKDPWRDLPMVCSRDDPMNASISCHGVRIVKRVIQQLLESAANAPSIEITEGVSLVQNTDREVKRARTMKGSILDFLEGRELRVKLLNLLPNDIEATIKNSLPKGRGHGSGSDGGGSSLGFGGGGKKGDNSFVILAVLMGKMLGAMGFGALALLAMKALMVSSLALLLSLIIAAKKFANNTPTDSGHHVVYAQEAIHHEKRSIPDLKISPYRGYFDVHGIPEST